MEIKRISINNHFHFYHKQPNLYSCGPTCLRMLSDYYRIINPKTGKPYSIKVLSKLCDTDTEYGTQFSGIRKGFKQLGMKLYRGVLSPTDISHRPFIATIPDYQEPKDHHYVIGFRDGYGNAIICDPYYGCYYMNFEQFCELVFKAGNWIWQVDES